MSEIIRGVNFGSYLFASLVAGYVMMGVDLMLDGFLGLFGTYRTYVEIVKLWGIFKGLEDWVMAVGHMANSVVLALLFVHPSIYRRLPGRSGLVKGISFGALWHVVVLIALVITASGGARFMGELLHTPLREHVSLFLLHIVWGGVLGLLYVPSYDLDNTEEGA